MNRINNNKRVFTSLNTNRAIARASRQCTKRTNVANNHPAAVAIIRNSRRNRLSSRHKSGISCGVHSLHLHTTDTLQFDSSTDDCTLCSSFHSGGILGSSFSRSSSFLGCSSASSLRMNFGFGDSDSSLGVELIAGAVGGLVLWAGTFSAMREFAEARHVNI